MSQKSNSNSNQNFHSEKIQKIHEGLIQKIGSHNFNRWFKQAEWSLSPQKIEIKVPNQFLRDWILENYGESLKFVFFKITGNQADLIIKTKPIQESLEDKFTPAPKAVVETPTPKVSSSTTSSIRLNPRYTFDEFVVGNSNQFVHAAARAASFQPGKSYNPLFIYGGVGLGKTHLLHAIGHEIIRLNPNFKVRLLSAEEFTNEVINSIRYDKTVAFRKKYRDHTDVLLIDDIQFIAGKERTMEEFFHTFNALYERGLQIVLTSDTIPQEIPKLEERLRSRFNQGLLADIQIPDFETRCAILARKADQENIHLPDQVCHYIAKCVPSNVRDLEGSLIRIQAFASLSNASITMGLTEDVLGRLSFKPNAGLSISDIQQSVADYFELDVEELKSTRRHKRVAMPRQIAMYLCKEYLKASFPEIGRKFGGKDHTTVMHAVKKIKGNLDTDSLLRKQIDKIEGYLQR